MDSDGYPTEEEFQKVRNWPYDDLSGLFAYLHELWTYRDWGWEEFDGESYGKQVRVYLISTAGWSGNEDLIRAMQDNQMVWLLCWRVSRAGGHYQFQVRKNG